MTRIERPLDTKDQIAEDKSLERYIAAIRYDGKIKEKVAGVTDEYIIDVYERGYGFPPTMVDVRCFATQLFTGYAVDARVRVSIMTDGIAIILPRELPDDVGLYRVLTIVDRLTPGTWRAQRPRFSE